MKRFFFYALGCLLLYTATAVFNSQKYKNELDEIKRNERTLLSELLLFKAADSLNAAEISELTLSLDKYRETHENDLKTIKDLEIKTKNLQSVNTMLTETSSKVKGKVIEIHYKDTVNVDTIRCVKSSGKWLDVDLCIYPNGSYTGDIKSRDSLLIAEEVKYKRFLGFLWRTNKIKERNIKVISRNPNTKILGVEFVSIKK